MVADEAAKEVSRAKVAAAKAVAVKEILHPATAASVANAVLKEEEDVTGMNAVVGQETEETVVVQVVATGNQVGILKRDTNRRRLEI